MSLKLDCPRREFAEALALANAAVRPNSPNQILQLMKLEAGDGTLRVSGCDGELWIVREVACMTHEPGSVCVPAKLLHDLVHSLPDGDVQVEAQDGQGMLVKQGDSEYRVVTQDAADFPDPPGLSADGELSFNMGALRGAIDSVIFAVSAEQHRQVLNGVQLIFDGADLMLVATDTHRLAVRKLVGVGKGTAITCVVPERALRAIKALPLSDEQTITLRFGEGRIGVEAGGALVVAQLLEGAYPNWERVVPAESNRSWTLECDQLADRLKRLMILARDSANRIRFSGRGDRIVLSTRSEDKGEAKEEVAAVLTNGDIEVAFNGKYIQDAVSPIKGPGVRVDLTESSRPAVFRDPEDDGYFCVIMPMALM